MNIKFVGKSEFLDVFLSIYHSSHTSYLKLQILLANATTIIILMLGASRGHVRAYLRHSFSFKLNFCDDEN